MRILELGKELGVDSKAIIDFLNKEGADVKSHMSSIPDNLLEKTKKHFTASSTPAPEDNKPKAVAVPDGIMGIKKAKKPETEEVKPEEKAKPDEKVKEEKKETVQEEPQKKKKIISVFNPQHSTTSQGKAAAQQRVQQQNQNQRPNPNMKARVPAKDRIPDDEKAKVVKPLPSRVPAKDRVPDDEKEIKKVDTVATEVKPKDENPQVQVAKPEQKPAQKTEQKPEQKPEQKSVQKAGESEAQKSLREKLVKGTVNITDIPYRKPSNDGQNKDRRDNRNSKDGNRDQKNFKDQKKDFNKDKDFKGQKRDFDKDKDFKDKDKDPRDNRDQRNGGQRRDDRRDQNSQGGSAGGFDSSKNNGKANKKNDKFKKPAHGDKFDRLENEKAAQKVVKQPVKPVPEEEEIKVITLPENISIKDFAAKLKLQPAALIKKLFLAGKIYTVNDILSFAEAEEIALENEIICEHEVVIDYIEELLKEEEDSAETLVKRPPVVCVMGHVDHGKTSLLDAIRKTNVISGEAGGITQHIGAYTVELPSGEKITFLDTPGHEAFTAMRLRGAQATDVAILVVAADDGVMPQTIEAINHAKAAGIHVIVAVNKIDKPGANIDKVKQELSDQGLIPEDWGGDTIFMPISAKQRIGIEELLEMVILDTEILELKANPDRMARGIVIEAKLDKGRGTVATLLVQKGTLKVGDHIAMGEAFGKVRAMINDKGERVKTATPSMPVEITGLSAVPNAGDVFVAFDNDKDAKNFSSVYIEENKKKLLAGTKHKMSLDDVFDQMKTGELKELDIIIKADVQGSAEAMKDSLEKLSNDEVIVKVIHAGVGNVSESDAVLASASNAIIIAFNVSVNADARMTIEHEKVDLRNYNVIYNAIDDVELAMKGMLEPIYEEVVVGHVEVRQTFKASGVGIIAGSYVTDGVVTRDSKIRLSRGGDMIYEGKVASLKRFNDDAKEVKSGFECGIVLDGFTDIKEGDVMEAYIMKEVPRV